MGYRHVRRRQSIDKPWIARDHGGAPGWAIIIVGMVVVTVVVLALVPQAA